MSDVISLNEPYGIDDKSLPWRDLNSQPQPNISTRLENTHGMQTFTNADYTMHLDRLTVMFTKQSHNREGQGQAHNRLTICHLLKIYPTTSAPLSADRSCHLPTTDETGVHTSAK